MIILQIADNFLQNRLSLSHVKPFLKAIETKKREKRSTRKRRRERPHSMSSRPGSYSYEARHYQSSHPNTKQYYNVQSSLRGSTMAKKPIRFTSQRSKGIQAIHGNRNQLYATEAEDLANDAFFYAQLKDNNPNEQPYETNYPHFIEGQYEDNPSSIDYDVHRPVASFDPDTRVRYSKRTRTTTVAPATVAQTNNCNNPNHIHPQKKTKHRKLKNVELIPQHDQYPNHNYAKSEKIFVSKLLESPDQLHEEIDNIFTNEFHGRGKKGKADKSHWELRIMPRPIYEK